jgi:tartrate-resistant acid phosphatase type 5
MVISNIRFVLMGNHDHYGNASAQIEYTKHSSKWILPDYNYSISIKTNNGAQDLIHILMLDTVILCGNTIIEGGQPVFASKRDKKISNQYFEDLRNKLSVISNSSAPYILVAGHFPVWYIFLF